MKKLKRYVLCFIVCICLTIDYAAIVMHITKVEDATKYKGLNTITQDQDQECLYFDIASDQTFIPTHCLGQTGYPKAQVIPVKTAMKYRTMR